MTNKPNHLTSFWPLLYFTFSTIGGLTDEVTLEGLVVDYNFLTQQE